MTHDQVPSTWLQILDFRVHPRRGCVKDALCRGESARIGSDPWPPPAKLTAGHRLSLGAAVLRPAAVPSPPRLWPRSLAIGPSPCYLLRIILTACAISCLPACLKSPELAASASPTPSTLGRGAKGRSWGGGAGRRRGLAAWRTGAQRAGAAAARNRVRGRRAVRTGARGAVRARSDCGEARRHDRGAAPARGRLGAGPPGQGRGRVGVRGSRWNDRRRCVPNLPQPRSWARPTAARPPCSTP